MVFPHSCPFLLSSIQVVPVLVWAFPGNPGVSQVFCQDVLWTSLHVMITSCKSLHFGEPGSCYFLTQKVCKDLVGQSLCAHTCHVAIKGKPSFPNHTCYLLTLCFLLHFDFLCPGQKVFLRIVISLVSVPLVCVSDSSYPLQSNPLHTGPLIE